jgi:putative ABC transport system permease protein
MNDLRFALRQLLKNPGFTAVAVLTLALGIGATTAIFSVVHAVLLQPLPYPEPDRLVRIHETIPVRGVERVPVSVANYLDWRRQAASFSEMAAHRWLDINLTGAGEARRLKGARVTSGFFAVLGVPPILGRSFTAEEEARGRHQVALISEEMWRRDFGGEASVLGRSLTLDGEVHVVVGVMPSRMRYPSRGLDVWVPAAFFESELTQRGNHGWGVVARLKTGIKAAQAGIEVAGIAGRIAAEFEDVKDFNARVVSLHEEVVGEKRTPLLVLLGAVGCVLAIACANVANLLLARASSRRKEFAIRASLGAGRGAILRQLLLESVTLSSVGGAFGILLAYAGVAVFRALPPQLLPRADEIRLSLPVLFFALGVSLGTGLLFGLVPAIRASGSDANEVLKEGGRGGSEGLRRNRYRASLVVAEVALSMVLLAGAGLLLRSFIKLQEVDPGFRAEGVATADLLLPDSAYPTGDRQAAVFQQVLERLRAQPGVEAAGAVFGLPQGRMRSKVTFEIEGRGRSSGTDSTDANYRQVSQGYFSTLEIPLLRGREFGSADTTNSIPVAVVNAAFVKRHFPGTPPGSIPSTRINIEGGTNTWLRIVGVVGDVRSEGSSQPPEPEVFLPFSQRCWGYASLVVRTRQDPEAMGPVLRAAVAAVDSNLPIDAVRSLDSLLDENLADRRLHAQLLAGFSVLALVLAATGIYGVMAYSVSRRIQEIGIRMALGARLEDVLVLVLRQGMGLTLAGILIGLAGGLAVARALSGLLFGIQPTDPPTFGGVTVLLAAVALFACWWPARRAAKVDPMVALRAE